MTSKIAETLDISDAIIVGDEETGIIPEYNPPARRRGTVAPTEQDMIDDFNYARDMLHELVEKGAQAFNEALTVAKETKQPRCFEVTSTLLKQVSDVSKDLLELSHTQLKIARENKEKNKPVSGSIPQEGDTHIHVGTTAELAALLNGKKDE